MSVAVIAPNDTGALQLQRVGPLLRVVGIVRIGDVEAGCRQSGQELVTDADDIKSITGDYENEDRMLVYTMVGAGVGLVVILSLYLVIMTHKVAGPLFKTSIYFDRMAQGRLTVVTPLRRGDMLQDFFEKFKEMHDAVRQRAIDDVAAMETAANALREARNQGDYRGDGHNQLSEELDKLYAHLTTRKKNLA